MMSRAGRSGPAPRCRRSGSTSSPNDRARARASPRGGAPMRAHAAANMEAAFWRVREGGRAPGGFCDQISPAQRRLRRLRRSQRIRGPPLRRARRAMDSEVGGRREEAPSKRRESARKGRAGARDAADFRKKFMANKMPRTNCATADWPRLGSARRGGFGGLFGVGRPLLHAAGSGESRRTPAGPGESLSSTPSARGRLVGTGRDCRATHDQGQCNGNSLLQAAPKAPGPRRGWVRRSKLGHRPPTPRSRTGRGRTPRARAPAARRARSRWSAPRRPGPRGSRGTPARRGRPRRSRASRPPRG